MPKIIFVHLLNDLSGSPKVLSQIIKSVNDRGYRTFLYTGQGGTGFLDGLPSKNRYFYYKRFRNRYATLIAYLISQVILFLKLLRYVNKDVIIYVNTMLPFGAALAGFVIRKPVYYHVHEMSVKPLLLKKFLRFIIQITARKVIYVSKALRDAEGFVNLSTYTIYNALPSAIVNKAEAHNYDLSNRHFKVLMISSLKSYKGVQEFMKIANALKNNTQIQFCLVLNAQEKEIEEYFNGYKFFSNMNIIARQENVVPFYQDASLVLNLSRPDQCVETFGLTVLEALAFGIPVIVPPVGGPAEIVREGQEGYLMSSYNTSEIAEKITRLSQDKPSYERLSKNARRRAGDFSENKFIKQILEVINE